MADPEMELPGRLSVDTKCSSSVHSGNNPGILPPSADTTPLTFGDLEKTLENWEEKRHERGRCSEQGQNYDRQVPVVLYYLTFETELPPVVSQRGGGSKGGAKPPPEPPDLKKLGSPFEWSRSRKDAIIWISCVATALTAFTAGSYAPGLEQMTAEWGVGDVAALVGITTFTTGFAIAPMVLAPFSEINGRRPVFIASGVLFVACQLCCAVARSYAGMLVARFFVGVGGSVFSTMVGGVVSDIYRTADRNTPMALFSGSVLVGTGLGPLTCAFIAEATTWRWIFYMQTITCGALIAVVTACFRETRGSVLLSRKARRLNEWYEAREAAGYTGVMVPSTPQPPPPPTLAGQSGGEIIHDFPPPHSTASSPSPFPLAMRPLRIRWRVLADQERASLAVMVRTSLTRPFHLLATEPVVFFFSLWVSFAWAVLYLALAAVPPVFRTAYGFSLAQANAVFAATIAAAVVATPVSIYQEKLAARRGWFARLDRLGRRHEERLRRRDDAESAAEAPTPAAAPSPPRPEARLYFSCLQSAFLPLGLLLFGLTARPGTPWPVPAVALALASWGIFSVYLAVFNYLADVYGAYASSALAAQSFCRNVLGGAFPLVAGALFAGLGTAGAGAVLAGVAAALTAVPWVLVAFGERVRARSRFASGLAE